MYFCINCDYSTVHRAGMLHHVKNINGCATEKNY